MSGLAAPRLGCGAGARGADGRSAPMPPLFPGAGYPKHRARRRLAAPVAGITGHENRDHRGDGEHGQRARRGARRGEPPWTRSFGVARRTAARRATRSTRSCRPTSRTTTCARLRGRRRGRAPGLGDPALARSRALWRTNVRARAASSRRARGRRAAARRGLLDRRLLGRDRRTRLVDESWPDEGIPTRRTASTRPRSSGCSTGRAAGAAARECGCGRR